MSKRMLQHTKKLLCLLLVSSVLFYIFNVKKDSNDLSCRQKVETVHNNSLEHKYVSIPLSAIINGGGLGNQLFEIFTILGIAAKLGRTPVYDSENERLSGRLKFFHKTVPRLRDFLAAIPIDTNSSTVYPLPYTCCKYFYNSSFEDVTTRFLVINGLYFQSFKYFKNICPLIFEILKPDANQRKSVSDRVTAENRQKFKTCVHVRRGDFTTDKMHEGTNPTFATNAIKRLYQRKPNSVFYIMSDAQEWVQQNIVKHLDNIVVEITNTSRNRAIEDLYFSRMWCDSFLITAPSSTFGWWLAYLSKNQAEVYYRDILETGDKVQNEMNVKDFYPPEWNKLGISKDGQLISKNN